MMFCKMRFCEELTQSAGIPRSIRADIIENPTFEIYAIFLF